jgi:hypothetical protein
VNILVSSQMMIVAPVRRGLLAPPQWPGNHLHLEDMLLGENHAHPHETLTTSPHPADSVKGVKRSLETNPSSPEEAMKTNNSTYRSAVGVALAAALILAWLALGVGVLGRDGDPANLMYIGVFAIAIIGATTARFKPHGMSRALLATALGQALVTVIALIAGVHRSGVSPVAEIVGLNGFFIAMFLASAWLFRNAAGEQPPSGTRTSQG